MEDLKSLDCLIKSRALADDNLNRPMNRSHCTMIAKEIGESWELLATAIGVADEDVYDINMVHTNPPAKRSALIKKWEELYGSGATYRKMAEGLDEIGNRKLTEKLLDSCKSCKQTKSSQNRRENVPCVSAIWNVVLCTAVLIFSIILLSLYVYYNHVYVELIPSFLQPNTNFSNKTNCTVSHDHDLPKMVHRSIFVNRVIDIQEITDKITNVDFLNINGAPGFGKSSLAIRVGYNILNEKKIAVRYVNIELSHTLIEHLLKERSKHDIISMMTSGIQQTLSKSSDLMMASESHSHLTLINNIIQHVHFTEINFFKELEIWSEQITCETVLIFDNCDLIFVHELHDQFFDLTDSLIEKSQFLLHVIVVSQERLLRTENFDQWKVHNLSEVDSVDLLQKIAPNVHVSRNDWTTIARLCEGSPLALKIAGKLIQYSQLNVVEKELKESPIEFLNRISDKSLQFSTLMDLVLLNVKSINNCWHIVSLFPGSFSRDAGVAIITEPCLDAYVSQSLLDEYLLSDQPRYEMHRLIKAYLKKVLFESTYHRDVIKHFKKNFRNYYETFLLMYAKKDKLVELDWFRLLSERHNIDCYQRILMTTANNLKNARNRYVYKKKIQVMEFLIKTGYSTPIINEFYFYLINKDEMCNLGLLTLMLLTPALIWHTIISGCLHAASCKNSLLKNFCVFIVLPEVTFPMMLMFICFIGESIFDISMVDMINEYLLNIARDKAFNLLSLISTEVTMPIVNTLLACAFANVTFILIILSLCYLPQLSLVVCRCMYLITIVVSLLSVILFYEFLYIKQFPFRNTFSCD